MGFVRRYGFFPGIEVITLIEGIIIVDLPPAGSVQGVGTGTSALVAEFSDCSNAVAIDGAGNITTAPQPVEIFSGQDLIDKTGGFDETIGEFGGTMGNGFVDLRNKQFSRLVVVPVNLASALGGRLTRDLPTNAGATNPTPVVPLQGGSVPASTEFLDGGLHRVRTAAAMAFTADDPFVTGVDGALANAAATLISAGSAFKTAGVSIGDVVALGVIGAGGEQGTDAGTYRVVSVDSQTQLTLEHMNGTAFAAAGVGAAIAFRVHPGATADTGHGLGATAGAYTVPCRPLDATIANATNCAPTVVPPASTAATWDPLSGLHLLATPTAPGIAYTAAVQAPNAPQAAGIDGLYASAIDSLLAEDDPEGDVNLVWAARRTLLVRNKLKTHVLDQSQYGIGRTCQIAPPLTVQSTTAATAGADPGVGANRDERVFYSWPGIQTFVPEAVGVKVKGADGVFYTNGIIDVPGDGWLTAVCSNLAPERNPGQAADPVPTILSPVLGYQRGVTKLNMKDYIALRAAGIAGIRMDKTVGPVFQSGITTSLAGGKKNINRIRFADFVDDSVADAIMDISKLPLTQATKDAAEIEIDEFLADLLSVQNPAAQRIDAYLIDIKSGNTPDLAAQDIYVIIYKVRMTPTADFIVLQSSIGPGVDTSS